MIVENFHWSLYDIDNTDIESLLSFISYYPQWKKKKKDHKNKEPEAYADQINWDAITK